MKHSSKKLVLSGLALAIAGVLVVGCGKKEDMASISAPAAAPSATLKLAAINVDQVATAIQERIEVAFGPQQTALNDKKVDFDKAAAAMDKQTQKNAAADKTQLISQYRALRKEQSDLIYKTNEFAMELNAQVKDLIAKQSKDNNYSVVMPEVAGAPINAPVVDITQAVINGLKSVQPPVAALATPATEKAA